MIDKVKAVLAELAELEEDYKRRKAELKEKAVNIVREYDGEITKEFISFYYWDSGLTYTPLAEKLGVTCQQIPKLAGPHLHAVPCTRKKCGNNVYYEMKNKSSKPDTFEVKRAVCDECKVKDEQKASDKLRKKLEKKHTRIKYLQELPYTEYLQTSHWQKVKKQALKVAEYKCGRCGARNIPLDVHHITYANKGCEPLTDLLVVCRPCHEAIHGRKFNIS